MRVSIRAGDVSFGAALAFLFGVFAANMQWSLLFIGAVGFLLLAAANYLFLELESRKFAVLFFLAAMAGVAYYSAFTHWQTAHTRIPPGKQATFFALVTEKPKAAGNFTMLVVSLARPYASTVDVFTTPGMVDRFNYGDQLWVKGTVTPSEDPGEAPAMFLPQLRVVITDQGFWLKAAVIKFKDLIIQRIIEAFPADQAALLAGIIVGTTGTIGASLKAQMESSGTTYIVAMFGYKIAVITSALTATLKDRLPGKVLLFVTLLVVAFFVFASGATTSAIRAAIMGSFAVVARGTGRVFSARNAITFAAAGMVIFNATLLTDAGFQLSFLSFLGIYYLGPAINNYFHWTDGGVLQWKEHAMLSLATNVAILPIVMNTFGEFSLTSLISNILIMIPWLAVIAFGALAVLLGFISPALAFCAVEIVKVFLQYELFIIHLFAAVTINLPAIFNSAFMIALYYGILFLFIYYYASPSQENN